MADEDPRVFVPQQFSNENNTKANRHHTALEIMEQVAGPIHGFCSGIGTGGTVLPDTAERYFSTPLFDR